MDNTDMSTNINAIGSFHAIDGHKKTLLADQSDVDSGYVENWSISHSNATASTSGISNSAKYSSLSFKKSTDLGTISENVELKGLNETPTTRSIRGLNAFHINSPKNANHEIETTPTKTNYFSNIFDSGSRNCNNKNHSQNSIRWSFEKSSPRLRSLAKRKSFTTSAKSFESIDEDYENIYNDEETNPCDQSIGVSPIKPCYNSIMMPKQSQKVREMQRHSSGIESSTPKTIFKRASTQSILKTKTNYADEMFRNIERKTQSFSPAKRLALRETNFQHSFMPEDGSVNVDEQLDNPARKVLAFNPQEFDKLVNELPVEQLTTHPPSTGLSADDVMGIETNNKIHTKLKNGSLKHPTAHNRNGWVSDFELTSTDMNKSAVQLTIKTPRKNEFSKNLIDTPTQNNFSKQNIREEVNRTPIKRFEKNTSYNFIQTKSSPEKEKFDIIYGHLPCTPPKQYPRRQLKRTATARSDSALSNAPSAKRKLYEICERPSFYNGLEKLDILSHLTKFDHFNHIIEKILVCLPDESLQAAYSVCKTWKNVVNGIPKFRSRRRRFVKKMQAIKENVNRNGTKTNNINNNNNNVKPLHRHNLNCETEGKHITVSPSTQRFNEHQKIIKSLKPEQRVLHCPRCNGMSIVHPETRNDIKAKRRSPRRQANNRPILQDRSLLRFSTIGATKNKTNLVPAKIIVSEYAACSKKACGFEFCTNCIGNRHINDKCAKPPLGSSPKSDDDSPYKHEHRTTKRHLRRLLFDS